MFAIPCGAIAHEASPCGRVGDGLERSSHVPLEQLRCLVWGVDGDASALPARARSPVCRRSDDGGVIVSTWPDLRKEVTSRCLISLELARPSPLLSKTAHL